MARKIRGSYYLRDDAGYIWRFLLSRVAINPTWLLVDHAEPEMKEAAQAVRNNLYIDDYLNSAGHLDEAARRPTVGQTTRVAVSELRRG